MRCRRLFGHRLTVRAADESKLAGRPNAQRLGERRQQIQRNCYLTLPPLFSVLIVASPSRTCCRPKRTASPRRSPVQTCATSQATRAPWSRAANTSRRSSPRPRSTPQNLRRISASQVHCRCRVRFDEAGFLCPLEQAAHGVEEMARLERRLAAAPRPAAIIASVMARNGLCPAESMTWRKIFFALPPGGKRERGPSWRFTIALDEP